MENIPENYEIFKINDANTEITIQDKKGLSTASFVIGISGVVLMFIPFVNLLNVPAQIIAFIMGILGLKSSKKGMATAGIVLGCIAFFMSIVISLVSISMFGSILNRIVDIGYGANTRYSISAELYTDFSDVPEKQLIAARAIISRRLDSYNVTGKSIRTNLDKGIISIKFNRNDKDSDMKNTEVLDRVVSTRQLTFQEVDEDKKDSSGKYLPTGKIIVSGSDISDAHAERDLQSGSHVISLKFNFSGTKKFADATSRLMGKPFAIFLDDNLIMAPTVEAKITDGMAVINGQRSMEEAVELAADIRNGSLPLSFKIKNIKTNTSQR